MRGLARFLAAALVFSTSGPSVLCGGGVTTKQDATDCCRAMHFACHKRDGNGSCCKHDVSAPAPMAVAPRPHSLVDKQPRATGSFLPAIDPLPLLVPAARSGLALSEDHPPPQDVPLFLLHSIFRI